MVVSFWKVFDTVVRSGWPFVGLVLFAVLIGLCGGRVREIVFSVAGWIWLASILILGLICFAGAYWKFGDWIITEGGWIPTLVLLMILAAPALGTILRRSRR